MSVNRYYQSELNALRHLGRRFCERNPALAPFLGDSGRDPDVERLLEGFAFLTGRLRQKLDDQLPELSHSLMHLLWPNYMRPLPAFSMLQFAPLLRAGPAITVERDTPVESVAIDGERCRFRTCYATDVLPLQISALDYSAQGEGALLNLRLEMTAEGHMGELVLEHLRLHFAGERYVSQMLYVSLLRHLQGIDLLLLDGECKPLLARNGQVLSLPLPASVVRPAGFSADEALLPYPPNAFTGYRHLQEYFAFPDKYLFVDVGGLDILQTLPHDLLKQARGFELRFKLRQRNPGQVLPTADNVKLFCTPVVNLFKHDGVPIRLDGKQDEYLLLGTDYAPGHCGVFSVDQVTGWRPGGLGYQAYVPFESFEHDQQTACYSIRQRPSLQHSGLDTYLSFGIRQFGDQETLSIELTCTNHDLPRKLRIGDINQACEQTPEFLSFNNITAATPGIAPPLDSGFLWKLISNMSLNYLSLSDINALKVVLKTYDLPRYHDRQAEKISLRRLDGLRSISQRPIDRLHGGLPIRGVAIDLTLDPQHFLGEGDLFVFASVLNEFFALYASLNSYHELRVTSTQGEVYLWPSRMGQQALL
ncbi:type VI secretion system protein ImpG [Pseudomonas gessardii]|uniref:Type VI secretion system baseplate subunit TssF n=1 Tax=Pseudomonas gessardii TaxID=78544 RepID=A0A7Y1QLN2_9PSED|nr:type VI secretion system baseplate subunit TssF [Pseudomonas gessardii]MRU51690.1 type VI secretion system baseplate subunit TssF [Pseudomonas gessardii]NNA96300.1 type VI secretion system baseplate subunit TssF [Pseudomonas gessardii]ONH41799.1 type VI secretion protein [Pseudomonas gessardii]SDQ45996.1 type VI secretion system protein ImpG [Pseudomonas gessardii]